MKTTQEMIEVMQAAERGEQIERKQHGVYGWILVPSQIWNWEKFDYRIKPKPYEVWARVYDNYQRIPAYLYGSKEACNLDVTQGGRVVLLREVV